MAKFVEFTGAKNNERILINMDNAKEIYSIDVLPQDKAKELLEEMPNVRTIITFGTTLMGAESVLVRDEYDAIKAVLTGQ